MIEDVAWVPCAVGKGLPGQLTGAFMSDKDNRDIGHAMFGLGEPGQPRGNPNAPSAPQQGYAPPPQSPQAPAGANQVPPPPYQAVPPGPQSPQYIYVQGPPPSSPPWAGQPVRSGGRALPVLVGLLIVLTAFNLYLILDARANSKQSFMKNGDQLTLLSRRMDSSDDRYAQLRGQFDVTSQRLGMTQQELTRARTLAANIQTQQRQAVQQLNQAIQQKASAQDLNKLQTDSNAKFGSLSGDIAGTQKDLDATKEALAGTKGELSGAIARTHDELVELAHRTDRDYYEFTLAKKHNRQKVGTVMLELTKTNLKRNLYTINLYFDDKRTERKDNAIDAPIFFYVQGAPNALELVVNKLNKNSVSGYISAPKGFFPSTPNVLTARPT